MEDLVGFLTNAMIWGSLKAGKCTYPVGQQTWLKRIHTVGSSPRIDGWNKDSFYKEAVHSCILWSLIYFAVLLVGAPTAGTSITMMMIIIALMITITTITRHRWCHHFHHCHHPDDQTHPNPHLLMPKKRWCLIMPPRNPFSNKHCEKSEKPQFISFFGSCSVL